MRPTDVTSHNTNEIGTTDAQITPKPRRENLTTTARTADVDAETDTQTPDRGDHGKQTHCGGQPDRVRTNDRTFDQETSGALNTTALVDSPSQDTFHVDMEDPVDQSVRDHGKGAPLVYSRDKQDYRFPPAGESVMSAGTISPKRIKKLRTERDVSTPRERTRSKTRATKPYSDAPSI
jgi:hypothetical protein